MVLLYMYFFFHILVQIFFGFFFFFLLESRTDKFFFNLMVFLIFDCGLGEWVRNGWGGRLWNVGRAYLFFLHSLMGKKKNFAGATAPPSHYVASPLT